MFDDRIPFDDKRVYPNFNVIWMVFFPPFKHNNSFDLTNYWHPQVNLLGKGPTFEWNFDDNGIQFEYL
jgi:hypothetical protein